MSEETYSNPLYDFNKLLHQNIKIQEGEIKMTDGNNSNNIGFKFPDNIGSKNTIKDNNSSINVDSTQQNNDSKIIKTPENSITKGVSQHQEATPQQKNPGFSPSDFEKLKANILSSINEEMNKMNSVFDKKIEELNGVLNKLNGIADVLNHSANTYSEINILIENVNSYTKEYIIESKDSIEHKIKKVEDILTEEIKKNDELIEVHLKKSKTKHQIHTEDDDDEKEEKKYTKDDDDDDDEKAFAPKTSKPKPSLKNQSFFTKIFAKMGM